MATTAAPAVEQATRQVVSLDFTDLDADVDLTDRIGEAFGYDGLGILTVKNIPGLPELRQNLLPLARTFADLPDEVKNQYEHPESCYSFGWSHGKEKLQGKPDLAKGSFYANPQYDRPVEDPEILANFAPFVHPNIWPTEHVPEMEPAFKALGQLVVRVGMLVGRQCDRYVQKQCPEYEDFKLFEVIRTSKCCKARLLHYFPMPPSEAGATDVKDESVDFSDWCGWHNDHGSLTGLVPAIYMDADGAQIPNPDPTAGLYIRSRDGTLVKAVVDADGLAFQIGETAQIHSGGLLQATPHAVRGANAPGVSRETFAVFMEPNWDGDMVIPATRSLAQAQDQQAAQNLPPGVPPLGRRFSEGMDFGDFTKATLSEYY